MQTKPTCERFPICDDKITENDRCVIKIIGIHCFSSENFTKKLDWKKMVMSRVANYWSPTRQCNQMLSVDYKKSKTGRPQAGPLGDSSPG